jgi:hypothetical protein
VGFARRQEELLERCKGRMLLLQRQVQWLELEVRQLRTLRSASLSPEAFRGDDGAQRSRLRYPLGFSQTAMRGENERRLGREIRRLRADCSAAWRAGAAAVAATAGPTAADAEHRPFVDPRHKRFK